MNNNVAEDSSLTLGMTWSILGWHGKQRRFARANRLCFPLTIIELPFRMEPKPKAKRKVGGMRNL